MRTAQGHCVPLFPGPFTGSRAFSGSEGAPRRSPAAAAHSGSGRCSPQFVCLVAIMPAEFDVLIAGGGVIGASIAWRLARNQVRVVLLDAAAKIGSEASSAAAGMLSPG